MDDHSTPAYTESAGDFLRAAATEGRVSSMPPPSVFSSVRYTFRSAGSTIPFQATADASEFPKKPRQQVVHAEPRAHLPADSRHWIDVLSSAQQNLLLTPFTYADLSTDTHLHYRVLFQTAYLAPDYPIHPYFTRRIDSGPVLPFVAVLTAQHLQRLFPTQSYYCGDTASKTLS